MFEILVLLILIITLCLGCCGGALLVAFRREILEALGVGQQYVDPIVCLPEILHYTKKGTVLHLDPTCRAVEHGTTMEKPFVWFAKRITRSEHLADVVELVRDHVGSRPCGKSERVESACSNGLVGLVDRWVEGLQER